jgi:16S rRNA G527 N7-methylase RsmG
VDFSTPDVLDSARFNRALGVVGSVASVPESGTLIGLAELLARWNRRINLVSRASDPASILADALVDAAALTRVLGPGDGEVSDLGAGAGLVSVALALLAPDLELVLVESNTRKSDFLRRTAAFLADRRTGGLTVVNARLEELEGGPRGHRPWRAAFSRAVWPPVQGWRRAAPHLTLGGLYIALVGPDADAPEGWNRADYAELFPDPEDYGARKLLWRIK